MNTWTLRSVSPLLLALCAPACADFAPDGSAGYGDDGDYVDEGGDAGMVSQGADDSADDGDADVDDGEADDGMQESEEGQDTEDNPACNADDDVALFLSPDDSNSMSSPVQAREALLSSFGSLSGLAIRPWEFLNYYRFAYPPAEPGSVAVHAAMMLDATDTGDEYVLQIGIASEAMANDERPPMSLTFVLDTSGSMEGHSLEMMKATCRQVAALLGEGDVVSMVTWNTQNNIVLSSHTVTGANDTTLLAAIDALEADGGTDLHSGLVAGYQLAAASHRQGVVSRVLLVSDGGANVGITDEEIIAEHAGDQGSDGIYLVGVGVGDSSTYNDLLMDRVTDVGKGA